MSKKYRLIIKVVKIRGRCPVYKLGDKMVVEDPKVLLNETSALCMHAFSCMLPLLLALCRGIEPSEIGLSKRRGDIGYVQCVDPGERYTGGGTVVFEIERVPASQASRK